MKAWFPAYLLSAWLGHFCQGLGMGILGPTQPYLAAQVREHSFDKALFEIRLGCQTTRLASSGLAGRLVTAWLPSLQASSSGGSVDMSFF